jgi:hypothetical protein
MPKHFSLSDVVSDRASVSFRFSIHGVIFHLVVVRAVDSRPSPRPDPAQPWRKPTGAPFPMHAPSPLPLIFLFLHNNFPLPLFHLLCPRCDPVDGCRRSSDPNMSFLSPLLSPSLPFSLLVRAAPLPLPLGGAPAPSPIRRLIRPLPAGAWPSRLPVCRLVRPLPAGAWPSRPRAWPSARPRRGPCSSPGATPCARSPVPARSPSA